MNYQILILTLLAAPLFAVDTSHPDALYQTPLFVAANINSVEVVKELLKQGASPNSKTNYNNQTGITPLHITASHLAYLADLDKNSAFAQDPVSRSLRKNKIERHLEIARLLIEYGAGLHAEDSEGFTPAKRYPELITIRKELIAETLSADASFVTQLLHRQMGL
jgi:hypothetical protein